MKIVPGHEDLRSKKVVGIDTHGLLLVQVGGEVRRYELTVGPSGNVQAHPFKPANNNDTPDQVGVREEVPVAARWLGVDQT